MNAEQAAAFLQVSKRQVYTLAAPQGPIPCVRIGKRVIFDEPDLMEFKLSCRSIKTKSEGATFSSSRAVLAGNESALQKLFRKRGLAPKLTPTTGKSPHGFMRQVQASRDKREASRTLSLVT